MGEDLLVVCVMGVVHILLELFDWTASVYEGGESSVRFSWYVGQPASTGEISSGGMSTKSLSSESILIVSN